MDHFNVHEERASCQTCERFPEVYRIECVTNRIQELLLRKWRLRLEDARELGILKKLDWISMNKDRQIADAKQAAIDLAEAGYTMQPQAGEDGSRVVPGRRYS